MASTIVTKNSSTASAVPVTGDLTQGELAVNVTDKRLFTKNSGGTVVELGTNPSSLALPNGTANGVAYLNGSKAVTTGSALTFDGTNFIVADTTAAYSAAGRGNITIGGTGSSLLGFRVNSINKGYIYHTGTNLTVANDGNGAVTFETNATEGMRLTSTGLGIGTSSPSYKLDVTRGASSGVVARLGRDSGAAAFIYADSSQIYYGAAAGVPNCLLINEGSNYLTLNTNGSERARIDSSGNLLVGVTSASNRLYVKQTTTSIVNTYLEHSGASPYGFQIYYSGAAPNNADNEFIYCSDTSNNRFIVYSSGNVANRNNSYGGISDVKLKENIVDATPKLADLMRVKVRNYNMIGETKKQLGVIAQELETVFPSMIDESPDRDAKGNKLGTTTKQVKYSVFVPMLIKALQELKAEFDAYKATHP